MVPRGAARAPRRPPPPPPPPPPRGPRRAQPTNGCALLTLQAGAVLVVQKASWAFPSDQGASGVQHWAKLATAALPPEERKPLFGLIIKELVDAAHEDGGQDGGQDKDGAPKDGGQGEGGNGAGE